MEDKKQRFPISETFTSPQGEGLWTGTLMKFIRFAGCSVGKKHYVPGNCHTLDGRAFDCDTNFSRAKFMTVDEILDECEGVSHVCLTGGEPLDHNLTDLVDGLIVREHHVHLETSGTKSLQILEGAFPQWIACSPKLGMLDEFWYEAHEFKFLVDKDFDIYTIPIEKISLDKYIWLQPVNYRMEVDQGNLKRCLTIIEQHQNWRLSVQMHKLIHVR